MTVRSPIRVGDLGVNTRPLGGAYRRPLLTKNVFAPAWSPDGKQNRFVSD